MVIEAVNRARPAPGFFWRLKPGPFRHKSLMILVFLMEFSAGIGKESTVF
jgi:hypothetical protein